jgi:hypothetical protein
MLSSFSSCDADVAFLPNSELSKVQELNWEIDAYDGDIIINNNDTNAFDDEFSVCDSEF